MSMKSERLKKLETELEDLEQWMNLGLVPKKDLEKHKEEIRGTKAKLDEEKERLRFMKESGEMEEYVTPKRNPSRQAYAEAHTLPDMDMNDNMTDAGLDMETEGFESETATEEEIREYCKKNMAPFKVPTQVEFRSELPKTTVGKVLRRELVREHMDKLAANK